MWGSESGYKAEIYPPQLPCQALFVFLAIFLAGTRQLTSHKLHGDSRLTRTRQEPQPQYDRKEVEERPSARSHNSISPETPCKRSVCRMPFYLLILRSENL